MKIVDTALPGVLVIEPAVYRDARGFFLETFHDDRFATHNLPTRFRQDNHSRSTRGVLRGLHYQIRRPQGKLVTVVRGEVFDVAVDVRRDSPTFARWMGITLSGDNPRYVWVPPGFAHGFCVLSDVADFVYKCTDVYTPGDEGGVLWNDPAVGIEWPISQPILSEKDAAYPPLTRIRSDLPHLTTEPVGA